MSTIKANTLLHSDGTTTTQPSIPALSSVMAKVWLNYNGNGTPVIYGSYGVSSVTDNGTGHYTINYATTLNSNYQGKNMSADVGGWSTGRLQVAAESASNSQVKVWHQDGSITDGVVYFIAFGD